MPKSLGGTCACSAAGSQVPVVVVPWDLACRQCKSSLTFLPRDLWGSAVKPNLKDTASPACLQPSQRLALRSGAPGVWWSLPLERPAACSQRGGNATPIDRHTDPNHLPTGLVYEVETPFPQ